MTIPVNHEFKRYKTVSIGISLSSLERWINMCDMKGNESMKKMSLPVYVVDNASFVVVNDIRLI